MSAIKKAIRAAGGLSLLAAKLDVTPQVVVNWRKRGIPAERVLDIERATEGKVTRFQLRPDLYPREMPSSVAAAQPAGTR